jgi:hypothetical protein
LIYQFIFPPFLCMSSLCRLNLRDLSSFQASVILACVTCSAQFLFLAPKEHLHDHFGQLHRPPI